MLRLRAVAVLAMPVVLIAAECGTEPPPDTCETGLTLSIGTPVTGAVAGGDCALDGRHVDSYAFSVAAQSIIRFNTNGQTGTDVRVRTAGNKEIALHDNDQTQFATFVILTPGDYILDVAASEDGEKGDYTIGSTLLTAPQPIGCLQPPGQWMWAAIGVDVAAAITADDCAGAPGFRFDGYLVYMTGNQPRTITVTGAQIGNNVEIRAKDQPALLKQQARNTAGANVVSFTPPQTGYYQIGVIWGVNGTYSFKVQ